MLKKDAIRCVNGEANDMVELNEDKSIDTGDELKVLGKSSRSLSLLKTWKQTKTKWEEEHWISIYKQVKKWNTGILRSVKEMASEVKQPQPRQ